jgi:hypothetical protein
MNKEIGGAEITVIFGNFVFQNQVVPEGVPGEITNYPMVLVEIVAVMGENQIGFKMLFQLFKAQFDFFACRGEEAGGKILNDDLLLFRLPQEQPGAFSCFPVAGWISAEDYPKKLKAFAAPNQPQDRSPATDFYVIRMRSQAKHPNCGLRRNLKELIDQSGRSPENFSQL